MRSIGVEAQFLGFNTGVGKPEVIVRRSDIVAIKPNGGSCTLLVRGGADIEIQENVNVVMTMLTYTPD